MSFFPDFQCSLAYCIPRSKKRTTTLWLETSENSIFTQIILEVHFSLKFSAPHHSTSRNFLNVSTWPLTFCFCLNNFQTKKFDVLRQSFDWQLISPLFTSFHLFKKKICDKYSASYSYSCITILQVFICFFTLYFNILIVLLFY